MLRRRRTMARWRAERERRNRGDRGSGAERERVSERDGRVGR